MRLITLFATLIALTAPAAWADTLTPAQKAQIDTLVTAALAKSAAPSASIAVVADGQIAYLKAYGDADLSPRIAATPAMRYAIGSVSKQFTAAAVLLLAQDGKLTLDEPISRWYPHVTGADKITLRHLLSHTSGIADFWPQDYVMTPMTRDADPDGVIAEWGAKPLVFPPGERYEYSNTGFMIAGRIVEKVSGQSLESFLRQRIWKPLGMTSVVNFDNRGLTAPRDVIGYDRAALGPARPALHEGSGWGLGAFQWAMTAEDLAKWDVSLINRSLLSRSSYDQFFAATVLNNGQSAPYALGLAVSPGIDRGGCAPAARLSEEPSVSHTGEVSGFVSANTVYLADRAAVVVLTNAESESPASGLLRQIVEVLPPPPRPTELCDPISVTPKLAVGAIIPSASSSRYAALDARVAALFAGLQKGQVDRSAMTQNLSDYFSATVVEDFATSLGPLGPALSIQGTRASTRGGMDFRLYAVRFAAGAPLSISVYAWPDGRLEQFLVGQ